MQPLHMLSVAGVRGLCRDCTTHSSPAVLSTQTGVHSRARSQTAAHSRTCSQTAVHSRTCSQTAGHSSAQQPDSRAQQCLQPDSSAQQGLQSRQQRTAGPTVSQHVGQHIELTAVSRLWPSYRLALQCPAEPGLEGMQSTGSTGSTACPRVCLQPHLHRPLGMSQEDQRPGGGGSRTSQCSAVARIPLQQRQDTHVADCTTRLFLMRLFPHSERPVPHVCNTALRSASAVLAMQHLTNCLSLFFVQKQNSFEAVPGCKPCCCCSHLALHEVRVPSSTANKALPQVPRTGREPAVQPYCIAGTLLLRCTEVRTHPAPLPADLNEPQHATTTDQHLNAQNSTTCPPACGAGPLKPWCSCPYFLGDACVNLDPAPSSSIPLVLQSKNTKSCFP